MEEQFFYVRNVTQNKTALQENLAGLLFLYYLKTG